MKDVSLIEQFIKGKLKDDTLCEDAIFVGSRFIAVIDGVTSKTRTTYKGKTPGKYAAEVIQKELLRIENEEQPDTTNPVQILLFLNQALKESVGRTGSIPISDYPRAAIIFCDLYYQVVVSYGDCKAKIGDFVVENEKRIDIALARKRSRILREYLQNGKSAESLRDDDPGRAAIQNDLLEQFSHENRSDDIYGYPILNGCGINKEMVKVYTLPCETTVILCSDGYPALKNTLMESEESLSRLLGEDPLLIGQNSIEYLATKGFKKGTDSFDDRAWIKFAVKDDSV